MKKTLSVSVHLSALVMTAYTVYYVARRWLDRPAKQAQQQEEQQQEQGALDEEVLRWCSAEWFQDLDYAIDEEVRAWWEQECTAQGPLADFLDPELHAMWRQATHEDPSDYADPELYAMYLQALTTPERHGARWALAALAPSRPSAAGAIREHTTKSGTERRDRAPNSTSKVMPVTPRGHGLLHAISGCFGHGGSRCCE